MNAGSYLAGKTIDLLQQIFPSFRTHEGFDMSSCLHRLNDGFMPKKARSPEHKHRLAYFLSRCNRDAALVSRIRRASDVESPASSI